MSECKEADSICSILPCALTLAAAHALQRGLVAELVLARLDCQRKTRVDCWRRPNSDISILLLFYCYCALSLAAIQGDVLLSDDFFCFLGGLHRRNSRSAQRYSNIAGCIMHTHILKGGCGNTGRSHSNLSAVCPASRKAGKPGAKQSFLKLDHPGKKLQLHHHSI